MVHLPEISAQELRPRRRLEEAFRKDIALCDSQFSFLIQPRIFEDSIAQALKTSSQTHGAVGHLLRYARSHCSFGAHMLVQGHNSELDCITSVTVAPQEVVTFQCQRTLRSGRSRAAPLNHRLRFARLEADTRYYTTFCTVYCLKYYKSCNHGNIFIHMFSDGWQQ